MFQKTIFWLYELFHFDLWENWEDLGDLRQAKNEQKNEPTYSLEQVKAMLNI